MLVSEIGKVLAPVMDAIVITIVTISAVCSLYDYVCSKTGKKVSEKFHSYFGTSLVYVLIKFVTLAFVIMCSFNLGPEDILDSARDMVGFGATLTSLALGISFVLVFLTDSGLMEFSGELLKPIVRPLFKIPADASIDCLTSWIGSSDAAVMVTKKKYERGDYTKREAAAIMCNFSIVSLPFCMVIAELVGLGNYFVPMYGLICALGILLAFIIPRIYPINKIEDTYLVPKDKVEERSKKNIFVRAFSAGCDAARDFSVKKVLLTGWETMSSVLLSIMPYAIGLGVIGMFVVNFTPIFNWISMPMGWLLNLMGVESAFEIAPATLVGFIDQYIPPLLVVGIESIRSRFIIAVLSLIQIIYLTIVGAVAMQCKIGLNLWKLFLVFMERTLIALPIIVIVSKMLFP